VTCEKLQANTVIVAGMVKGNIQAEKLEIRSTGRVWGDVQVVAFSTEEGSFLRGQVTMEDRIELEFDKPLPAESSNLEETVAQPSSQPIKLTDEESRPEIVKPEKSRTKKKK